MFHHEKKVIYVEGMHCEHCAKKVENALSMLDGVTKVKVNLQAKEVIVTLKKSVTDEILKDAIEALDYQVLEMK